MNDHTRQLEELMIVPMSDPPASNEPDPSYDDRRGRLVVVGLVMALLFLLVAAVLWWASDPDGQRSEALVFEPASAPNPTAAIEPTQSSAPSTLPLSSYPMPANQATSPSTAPAPPVASQPPASAAPVARMASVIPTTTTTTPPTTTTVVAVAPAPTLAPATTVARTTNTPTTAPTTTTTAAPATVAPTTTVEEPTVDETTTVPSTTVPGPVVTSPADSNATLLDVIDSTPDLSRVRELVELSGLQAELADAAARTFFAPCNDAIDAFATTAQGDAVLADPELLRQLLLRHLVPEALDEPAIFSNDRLETMSGDTLVVLQGSRTVDGADLLVVDVTAANGYLHLVSDVLAGTA